MSAIATRGNVTVVTANSRWTVTALAAPLWGLLPVPNCTCRKKLDRRRYSRDFCSYKCWKKGQARGMANIRRFRAEQEAQAIPVSLRELLDAGCGDVTVVDGQLVKISEAAEDDPELAKGSWKW
jgi:hypothetical protein